MTFVRPEEITYRIEQGQWLLLASPHAAPYIALKARVDGGELDAEPTFENVTYLNGRHQIILAVNTEHSGLGSGPIISFDRDDGMGGSYLDTTSGTIVGAGFSAPIYHGLSDGENCLLCEPGIDPAADPFAGTSSAFKVDSPPAVAGGGGTGYSFPAVTNIYWGSVWEVYAVNPDYVAPPPDPPTPHALNPCPPVNPPWPYPDPSLAVGPGPPGIIRRGR